jgi:hypothetical protein
MVLDNHAECKTAILGLMDALARIKKMTAEPGEAAAALKAIQALAADALDRHGPILPRL